MTPWMGAAAAAAAGENWGHHHGAAAAALAGSRHVLAQLAMFFRLGIFLAKLMARIVQ